MWTKRGPSLPRKQSGPGRRLERIPPALDELEDHLLCFGQGESPCRWPTSCSGVASPVSTDVGPIGGCDECFDICLGNPTLSDERGHFTIAWFASMVAHDLEDLVEIDQVKGRALLTENVEDLRDIWMLLGQFQILRTGRRNLRLLATRHSQGGKAMTACLGDAGQQWGCPALTDRADGSVRLPAR
jgi:hypothetical protein